MDLDLFECIWNGGEMSCTLSKQKIVFSSTKKKKGHLDFWEGKLPTYDSHKQGIYNKFTISLRSEVRVLN